MLREQREIYNKLADKLLDEAHIEELKKALTRWEDFSSEVCDVGNTSYYLKLDAVPCCEKQEISLYVEGYIATKDGALTLISIRRDVEKGFINADEKSLKTLSWLIGEFKGEVQAARR